MGIFKKKETNQITNDELNKSIVNANYLVNLANDINIMKQVISNKNLEILKLTEANKKLTNENANLKQKLEDISKICGGVK